MSETEKVTSVAGDETSTQVKTKERPRNLLNVNTEARFYMDETRKITDRAEAVKAIRKLWSLHSEMEGLAKPEHPAILDITRREILRLKQDFGVTTEEELGDADSENTEKEDK